MTSFRFPARTIPVVGIALDAEHVGVVGDLIRWSKCESANRVLATWSAKVERLPLAVIAFAPARRDGAVVGGLAAEWADVERLVACVDDWITAQVDIADFTMMWLALLSEPNRAAFDVLITNRQTTGGSA